jgi:WD40-like Beta Propeller Repeat
MLFNTRGAAVAAVVLGMLVATAAAFAHPPRFTDWESAINLESIPGTNPDLNTQFLDGCPIQAPGGLSLYMASNRPGGVGGLDIWVARREHRGDPWGAPQNVGPPVNSPQDDFCPSPTRGPRFFFVSTRPGGCGDADLYVTHLSDGGWTEPENLGCHVNSPAAEASPSLFRGHGGHVLYFSSARPGGYAPDPPNSPPDSDIYRAEELSGGSFAPAELVPGMNTADQDARPNVRLDGLEVVFDSNRSGTLGGPDIYSSTRASRMDAWSAPVNLGTEVNTPSNETRASLSSGGRTMVFGSNRPGTEGSTDIYVTTRERLHGLH